MLNEQLVWTKFLNIYQRFSNLIFSSRLDFREGVPIQGKVSFIQLQKATNLLLRNWEKPIRFWDSIEPHAYSPDSLHT
jgi:hypothetical protein